MKSHVEMERIPILVLAKDIPSIYRLVEFLQLLPKSIGGGPVLLIETHAFLTKVDQHLRINVVNLKKVRVSGLEVQKMRLLLTSIKFYFYFVQVYMV